MKFPKINEKRIYLYQKNKKKTDKQITEIFGGSVQKAEKIKSEKFRLHNMKGLLCGWAKLS